MSQVKFYLQASDINKETFSVNGQVCFTWNMLYLCNYRCSYCFFEGKWEEYEKRNIFLTVSEWCKIWERIYEKYGRCSLLLTGGEPFLYPNFIELIYELSKIHYPINISTNASILFDKFIDRVDLTKVSLNLAFHPEFNTLEDVINKLKKLKDKSGLPNNPINFVAYPPFLDKLEKYVEVVIKEGEILKVIPFIGYYNNKKYPESYSEEEKRKLGINEIWEGNVKRKGKLCSAGRKSALIFPDGKVARCGQIGEDFIIGNIFDENFKLLEQNLICEKEMCPCLEFVE